MLGSAGGRCRPVQLRFVRLVQVVSSLTIVSARRRSDVPHAQWLVTRLWRWDTRQARMPADRRPWAEADSLRPVARVVARLSCPPGEAALGSAVRGLSTSAHHHRVRSSGRRTSSAVPPVIPAPPALTA
jgi:hypothetical protein